MEKSIGDLDKFKLKDCEITREWKKEKSYNWIKDLAATAREI